MLIDLNGGPSQRIALLLGLSKCHWLAFVLFVFTDFDDSDAITGQDSSRDHQRSEAEMHKYDPYPKYDYRK